MDSQTYQNKQIRVVKQELTSMDCSPCGKYIVCSCWDKWIRKFDLVLQRLILKSRSYQGSWISSIRYSPNGQFIASGGYDDSIFIRRASTLEQLGKTMFLLEGGVKSITFSPDSQHLASLSVHGTISIWDCQRQEQVGSKIIVKSDFIQYSPSGLQILSAGMGGISIWDSITIKPIMTVTDPYSSTAQYSLDGRYIVSSNSHNMMQLRDATTGKQIGSDLVGHSSYIKQVAFSPHSSLIVSGSHDKTVRLWNQASGKQVSILHKHCLRVNTAQFSKDGKYVLSGSDDGTIHMAKMKF